MRVDVTVPAGAYPVHIVDRMEGLGAAMAARLPSGPALVVTNPVVAAHWRTATVESLRGAGFAPTVIQVPDGEVHKTLDTWQRLTADLLACRPERSTPVVALGGGVTGDLAGFAAATLLRGVPLVQVPTSLLAMVDSSVGGKTGVNAGGGKNLVGAFHQPALVYAALETLGTLAPAEVRSGLGEVVKHAVLDDEGLFGFLEARAEAAGAGDAEVLQRLVADSVRIKAAIVAADEREAGRRVLLNLGHTAGHAVEAAVGVGSLRHGECVALGLLAEARWAADRRGGAASLEARLRSMMSRVGLPILAPPIPLRSAIDAARVDKKWTRGTLRATVPLDVGQVELENVPAAEIPEMLRRVPGIQES